jgi:hypothetical protein
LAGGRFRTDDIPPEPRSWLAKKFQRWKGWAAAVTSR